MPDSLRAIIVDDEDLARRGLALRLAEIPEIELVAQCVNGPEALEAVAALEPDLLFLDIQMPGMNGFEVVCELQSDTMPLVVFVTAYDEYAVEAFRVHAVDYLLKPIDAELLAQAVARAGERHQARSQVAGKEQLLGALGGLKDKVPVGEVVSPEGGAGEPAERLVIKDGGAFHFVPMDDIQWIDAAGDYMCVHTREGTHIMRTTMKQLEGSLDPARFIRIHRSSIVNSQCIAGAEGHTNGEYVLSLKGGTRLKVSRSYRDRIRALIEG